MDTAARQALMAAAGAENFSDAAVDRLLYAYDGTVFLWHRPEAVIRAAGTAQVSAVLAACTAHRVPLVPRGAGSGLTGGAVPIAGGVVLDLSGLNRILKIDKADQVAVVQPGVVTARLQEAAAAQGLFYPPDPASVGFCTVGGNAAENAGGLRAVKYGVTRDYVLGLTAVLADGRVFTTGGANFKDVVGYDLTRLIVGSEGTLAVITELTMRLLPLPEAKATVSGLFWDLEQAAAAVQAVLASGIIPTACEFMDGASLKAVEAYARLGLPPQAEAMLVVDVDGPPEVVRRQAQDLARLLAGGGGQQVQVAHEAAAAEALWRARRVMGPAVRTLAPGILNEDVVVPLGRLATLMAAARRIGGQYGLAIPTFGHAGDGNLHVNVMYDPADPAQNQAAQDAVRDIFATTLSLGGTLSGEHGVGLAKLGYVGARLDPVALELMRGLKRLFDPAGILNPHKAIPGPEILP
ncbi:MAG: FAD-linked oxidase C-terminal domain-containing protein [Thermodesulfobacteriota bacterium]